VGGVPFESGVDFARLSAEVSGYLPLGDHVELAGRMFGGWLRPLDESRRNLTIPPTASDTLRRRNRTYQDRFSDYLFYAGGGSDVRGWTAQLAGGKVLRDLQPRDTTAATYAYRPVGARSKLGVNLEARLPVPGLGDSWRTAVFVDAAYLSTGDLNLVPPADVSGVVPGAEEEVVSTNPTRLLVGVGAGLRYDTPFGFVRLDAAYKLTPDALDLRRPGAVGRAVARGQAATAASRRPIRRFRLHFGIGRSF
jgi:outer membrane protein insertion porin family